MLNRIIDFALEYRSLVVIGIIALLAAGGYALYTIPVEAFPDLTNNQVVVVTEAPALPPGEVEQLVTYPVERAMMGLPNKEEVRSLSKLGLSMVTVVFDDSVPMYFARQLVSYEPNIYGFGRNSRSGSNIVASEEIRRIGCRGVFACRAAWRLCRVFGVGC